MHNVPKVLKDKIQLVKRVLNTADGEEFLAILDEQFNKTNLHTPGDPYTTAYNCGARDVVIYLKQMKESKHV